jgi:hypothetical protein
MQNGVSGWVLKQAAQQVWQRSMEKTEEKKKPLSIGINENSFELVLRILGNEFIAIRIGSTNFSGKLIAGSILLLFFTFMLLEVFGLSRILGIE